LTKNWRYELMGENFDETGIQSGKNAPARNKERVILDIIEKLQDSSTENTKVAYRIDIYNEAQSSNIDRNKVDDILEQLNRLGRVMMPRGYDTFQKM
jgi:DNA replicative helicase MCM subunit Mcm2 (Cdc46/Mcm family)